MKKVIVGSVLAAGVAASLFGAGSAAAAPGVSVSVDGNPAVGIGDQKPATGASAISSKGNGAIAVSLIGPANATAVGGNGNTAVTLLGGQSGVLGGPGATNNHVVAVGGGALVTGNVKDNNIVSVLSGVQTLGSSNTSVAPCGGSALSAQGSVIVSKIPANQGGVC
jgi:hypothetical protein